MDYYERGNRATWAVIRLALIHGPWVGVLLVVLDVLGLFP